MSSACVLGSYVAIAPGRSRRGVGGFRQLVDALAKDRLAHMPRQLEQEREAVWPLQHAIGNRDPFSGANVLSRGIVGDLNGEVVVASPVYKQHFSLLTGRCIEDASVSVPVYPVHVEGGDIVVL